MTDLTALINSIQGTTANGVQYIALPPDGDQVAEALIVLLHGADPPRTEVSLAGALPLSDLPAWRVYLGLPLSGQRMPEGGPDEVMRRGAEDAVTLLFHPIITGAVDELPAAIDDLRASLHFAPDLPLGLFGFSVGGSAVLMALARHLLPIRAAVTFGAIADVRVLVDHISSMFGATYEWTDDRIQLVEQISAVHHGRAIAGSDAHLLFGIGSDDPNPIRSSMEHLAATITEEDGSAEVQTIANLGHGFAEEPGIDAAPQASDARAVEQVAAQWFRRYLT